MKTISGADINGGMGIGVWKIRDESGKSGGQVKNGTIYAGNINRGTNDRIEQKRAQARKQATGVLREQFAKDNEITDGLNELRTRNSKLGTEMQALQEERKGYIEEQEALKERYGITDDSSEQQDLELYRRARDRYKMGNLTDFSKDELDRIAKMGELTEYQKRALEYDEVIKSYDSSLYKIKKEMRVNTATIEAIKRESVNNRGMEKAVRMADTILKEASDAITGMLWEDARKHVDEEMEKLAEAAKEAAEKKKEEEEKLEEKKEENKEQEASMEKMQKISSEQEKLQREIDKIMKDAELLQEDIKGLMVDSIF